MTVKTQGGKVITKDGKVSCGCCEEPGECCMYPAQAFVDGLYTVDDLPDALDYSGTNAPVTLNKLNTPEQSNRFDGIAYFRGEYEFSGQQAIVDLGIQEDNWKLGDSLNDQATTTSLCLIDDFRTEDQFADTYTVNGPTSGTVTRESVCVWRGTGLTLTNFGYQWKVNGNNKSGLQNTPVGSYAGGFTVS